MQQDTWIQTADRKHVKGAKAIDSIYWLTLNSMLD